MRNQQEYLLNKYQLNYDLDNLTKKELEHLGELQQLEDYQLINENMEQDIYFDLVHNINDNISNEERKLSNKLINKKHSYTNIDNRRFNNINLQKETILKEQKEGILKELKLIEEEINLKQKERNISFNSLYKPSVSNDLTISTQTYFQDNYLKKLGVSVKTAIKEFSEAVHNSIIKEVEKLKGKERSEKLRDNQYLDNLVDKNQNLKKRERGIDIMKRIQDKIAKSKVFEQSQEEDFTYENGFTR